MDGLRWRRGDLQGKINDVRSQLESLKNQEDELLQQLRAVEQLLFTSDGSSNGAPESRSTVPAGPGGAAAPGEPDADASSMDFSTFGPTARKIYASAEQVLREAGVPLHYRVLAEEVQKHAPLSGRDPGATLIAHLQRAQDLFPRVGRGVYGLQGMAEGPQPSATDGAGASRPTQKRRRTRRRRTR